MTEQSPPRSDVEQLAAALEQFGTAMRAYVAAHIAALAPAVAATVAAVRAASCNAQQAEYALAPPPDRPAWQSTHGPAHIRRKEQRP
ncbi:hypothetical protein ACFY8Q_07195 [[Kitasatospora] papulosa]|uniref:hypothetical protein n=1 Tax=[Kitasatospora] papulosa TaxID=1464011 RepID=UPI0036BB3F6E